MVFMYIYLFNLMLSMEAYIQKFEMTHVHKVCFAEPHTHVTHSTKPTVRVEKLLTYRRLVWSFLRWIHVENSQKFELSNNIVCHIFSKSVTPWWDFSSVVGCFVVICDMFIEVHLKKCLGNFTPDHWWVKWVR